MMSSGVWWARNVRASVAAACVTVSAAGPVATAAMSAAAFNPSPNAIEYPAWFKETFLDIREDVREATAEGKRLMLYFGQDGCPYCRELVRVNFSQKEIVDRARSHFHAVALNIWGDREVTWTDGRRASEKEIAARLRIQITPTLLVLHQRGAA